MPRSIGIEADGDVVVERDDGSLATLPASSWMGASTNANAQTAVNNFLTSNGFTGWGSRVSSRAQPTGLMITARPTVTNWWLGALGGLL